ncbi:Mediator of RNA polymerase II transcription subunit 14 [Fulvia fulva]|uniref:Mediator of RNA polymerase II transcription subunit 14 n=1 Tax=Passalora fulva TaxID=5499 RepID=A0A9Q8PJX9_PASFU|nr:Mediator of RNA polymerase II transcription subunit 14 [Fulvia fulva]KAK4611886.1 Mediator of RNA polymerase II transcription subunit 14 [Fulvia fulva]KAK4612369.1 Mediator of RNA polymerase II transcription subunit 14 [Fulvia fulva]UJO23792.1 Mediator of RNA polymerase II transcription subunit 14 [Fulvia fulva]WPV21484.1 Mediator of RNA polymerase II transcription subunit 14 [Fulvia fulva]WPV35892.1 Mediator of RNA polymerase II transcription subunit 14 [Fulvia fulva]
MPGRLIMDQQGAIGSQDLKKDRSQAQIASLPKKPDFAQHTPAPQVNGPMTPAVNGSIPNGTSTHNAPSTVTNGSGMAADTAMSGMEAPPELDQSWQENREVWKSMGKMIERTAQACYSDLLDTVNRLHETPLVVPAAQPNGAAPQVNDTSQDSINKKRIIMDFAKGQRDRFMKSAVLVAWAKTTGDAMSTLIDVRYAQSKEQNAQDTAIWRIGDSKKATEIVKQRSPNIQGALDLLATGKASHLPGLNFVQPKRMSAKQLLKTLQGMNVTLATRLNLHEDLPVHFNDFRIANGRATFRVPGEFEVDLSVADEEPTSQFYLIDIRFLFVPAPIGLHEALRAQLELRANAELSAKGLQGCYDFLHNFVLTHKINVLKSQVAKLAQEKWFDCLSVQTHRRVITLQYWTAVPGRKSWLEIGVATGKDAARRFRRTPNPQLSIRWFRRGEEMKDTKLDIDWLNLDVEQILSEVVARHISWSLTSIKDRLQALAGPESKLDMHLDTSESVPEDCSLRLSIAGLQDAVVVRQEPVTGKLSVSPPNQRATRCELAINSNEQVDTATVLASALCDMMKDRVDVVASIAGWSQLREEFAKDSLKQAFGNASIRAYMCSGGWGKQWALFATFSLVGEKWWVVRLADKPSADRPGNTRAIAETRAIPTQDRPFGQTALSRTALLQIEQAAAAEVSCAVLTQQLAMAGIRHKTDGLAPISLHEASATLDDSIRESSVFLANCTFLKHTSGKHSTITSLRVTHNGLMANMPTADEEPAMARYDLRLTVDQGQLKYLREYLTTKGRNADVAMNASGALALRLRTPFGAPYLDQIYARLKACQRLNSFIANINASKFRATNVSLSRLSFVYNESPELTATILLANDSGSPATLALEPKASNPQFRARIVFEKLLNMIIDKGTSFAALCQTLQISLPVLHTLDKLETAHLSPKDTFIHIRHPTLYTIEYRAPLPALNINILMQDRRTSNGLVRAWSISTSLPKDGISASAVGKALVELSKFQGDSWHGLGDGSFVALLKGAAKAIEQIDQTVRSSANAATTATTNATRQGEASHAAPKPQAPAQQKSLPNTGSTSAKTATSAKGGAKGNVPTTNGRPAPKPNVTRVKNEIIELD